MPTTRTAKNTGAGALTPEKLALLEELKAGAARGGQPDVIGRELTAREQVLAGLLRERDHLDGCPAIDDVRKAAARTEAYGETRPPDPAKGLGPRPVVIVRCVECGGSQYFDDVTRPDELILTELERVAAVGDDGDLDSTLT